MDSPDALAPLLARLGVDADALGSAPVKAALRANTEAAVGAGVFGVPTLQVGYQVFWGNDAHPFALAALQDAGVLADPEMQRVSSLPVGISRRP